jgi:hypothetical protein
LVDFVIERQRFTSSIKKIGSRGTNYKSIKEIGGYEKVQDTYSGKLKTVDGNEIDSLPTDIYKINFIHGDSELNNFRMYDEFGNDVSRYCMILVNGKLYTFTGSKWIQIKTRRG